MVKDGLSDFFPPSLVWCGGPEPPPPSNFSCSDWGFRGMSDDGLETYTGMFIHAWGFLSLSFLSVSGASLGISMMLCTLLCFCWPDTFEGAILAQWPWQLVSISGDGYFVDQVKPWTWVVLQSYINGWECVFSLGPQGEPRRRLPVNQKVPKHFLHSRGIFNSAHPC